MAPCYDCGNGRPGSSDEANYCQTPRKKLIRYHNYNILHLFDSF